MCDSSKFIVILLLILYSILARLIPLGDSCPQSAIDNQKYFINILIKNCCSVYMYYYDKMGAFPGLYLSIYGMFVPNLYVHICIYSALVFYRLLFYEILFIAIDTFVDAMLP